MYIQWFSCFPIRIKTLDQHPHLQKVNGIFMTLLSIVFGAVTVLASIHPTDNVVDSRETYISKTIANITMLAFSSTFGTLFTLFPRHLLSSFWEDEQTELVEGETVEKFMGFKLLKMTDLETWWARCIGTTILSLNLGVLIDWNIAQPLYTAGSLVTVYVNVIEFTSSYNASI